MSLISFASAKGSPGVTQALAGLSAVWPRRVVVADLDPIGGDVALRYRGAEGDPLDLDNGLVSLGAALRGGKSADLEEHLQTTENGMNVLVGMASSGQGRGLASMWPSIAGALSSYEGDVLADCGRFNPGSPIFPVIEQSSALVFVARSEISALSHLRDRLLALKEPLRMGAVDALPVGIALVGDPRDQRSIDDTERLLESSGLDIHMLGTIAHDPKTVENILNGNERKIARSSLMRSLVNVAQRTQGLLPSQPSAVQEGQ